MMELTLKSFCVLFIVLPIYAAEVHRNTKKNQGELCTCVEVKVQSTCTLQRQRDRTLQENAYKVLW